MQYKSILSLSVLLASVSATPTPASLAPRACQTILPSSYQQIFQDSPDRSGAQGRFFQARQLAGGVGNIDTLIAFKGIPAGSFGCQLAIKFPSGYPITNSGASQVNVYALPKDISPTDTYRTYFPNGGRGIPKDSFLFGTTTIDGGSAVINSQVCKPNLNYLVEIASDDKAGDSEFFASGGVGNDLAGFYITYNC